MRPDARSALALLPALLFAAVTWSCSPNPPHDKGMRFPLEGKHEALPCEACHGTGGFEALPVACASCHEEDRPIDHYPGDCGDCHTAFGWFNFGGTTTTANPHETTFPLLNAHDLGCGSCHVGEGYAGLDPECKSCHADDEPPFHYTYVDFDDCGPCHAPSQWANGVVHPADLPHHNAQCASCHPDAFAMPVISCLNGCHAQGDTDPLHTNVGSYIYESANCASCHFPP